MPLKTFFQEFRVIPVPPESVAYAVLLKNFDACEINPAAHQKLVKYDAGFAELMPVACVDLTVIGGVLVHREGVDPEMVKLFRNYILSPPKGSKMEKIRKESKNLQVHEVTDQDMAMYFKWLKEAEQKGWIAEFNDVMKTTPKPEFKK